MRRPLSETQLQRYFARIDHRGGRDATLVTLRALHRAHLLAIPYENLDIHLGRRVTLDPDATFDKLVDERRGGGRVLASAHAAVRASVTIAR